MDEKQVYEIMFRQPADAGKNAKDEIRKFLDLAAPDDRIVTYEEICHQCNLGTPASRSALCSQLRQMFPIMSTIV